MRRELVGMLLLALFLASPADARKKRSFGEKQARAIKCSVQRVVVFIQPRLCPATRFRPAMAVRRACCLRWDGDVRCKPFPKCPKRSRS